MNQVQMQQQASTSVLRQTMDMQETQGAAMVELLAQAGSATGNQQALDPMMGQNVNILA
ncbi:MAG: YjfB family protein [Spirochaetaceae bacterium]